MGRGAIQSIVMTAMIACLDTTAAAVDAHVEVGVIGGVLLGLLVAGQGGPLVLDGDCDAGGGEGGESNGRSAGAVSKVGG